MNCYFIREIFSTELSLKVKTISVQDQTATHTIRSNWQCQGSYTTGTGYHPYYNVSRPGCVLTETTAKYMSHFQRGSTIHDRNSLLSLHATWEQGPHLAQDASGSTEHTLSIQTHSRSSTWPPYVTAHSPWFLELPSTLYSWSRQQ